MIVNARRMFVAVVCLVTAAAVLTVSYNIRCAAAPPSQTALAEPSSSGPKDEPPRVGSEKCPMCRSAPADSEYVPHSGSVLCEPLGPRERVRPGDRRKWVVSYSLFGQTIEPYFMLGVRKNHEMVRYWYPEWVMRVYVATVTDASGDVVDRLRAEFPGAEFVRCKLQNSHPDRAMQYRMLAYDDAEVERYVLRDLDSVPGLREMLAVNEWVASRMPFHAMRDHSYHTMPVMGGMWGAVRGAFNNSLASSTFERYLLDIWGRRTTFVKGEDQIILRDLWPSMKGATMSHDNFFPGCYGAAVCRPFPITEWSINGFVGLPAKTTARMASVAWSCPTLARCVLPFGFP